MVNRVIIIGNLGQDAELRRLENGTAVARLSVATNESYKDKSGEWQTQTEWHTVVMWRGQAERAANLRKGNQVYIEGKLTTRTWKDKEGNDRRTTEVVANYFRQLDRRDDYDQPEVEPVTTPATTAEGDLGPDDDLPF